MSVSAQNTRIAYAGAGLSSFSYPYYFQNQADLGVALFNTSTKAITALTLTTDFTISGTVTTNFGYQSGATIATNVAVPTGTNIVIYNKTAPIQGLAITQAGAFPSRPIEAELDYIILALQRVADTASRTVKLPDGFTPSTIDLTLPSDLESCGGKVPLFNAGGTAFDSAANWPSSGAIAAAGANATAAAASAAAAATSATASATSATASAGSATAAAGSATSAAASAVAAAALFPGHIITDSFTGTGAQTAFTLSQAPGSTEYMNVYITGVYQQKSSYSVSTTTLTFTEAPPNGASIEVLSGVSYLGSSGSSTWGGISGTLSAQTDLQAALDAKQPLDSDLTTIAGLTATTNNFLQAKSSAWASRTPTQVTADLIAFVGDSGAGGTKGLVPAPVSGDATKFLKGDGTWGSIGGGGDALTTSPLSQFAATTSLQLKGVISDETGSGALVFANSPALVTPTGIVKGDVGLGNVDNTADASKPVSTAQATAIALKLAIASNLSDLASASSARTNLGLGNVDNTSDAGKPVSTATQTALDLKSNISSNINAQTTSYTLVAGDNGKTIQFTSGSGVNCTVPASLGTGFQCLIVQLGAGQVTLVASSTTINNRQSFTKTAGQYAAATLLSTASNVFISSGDMA